VNHTPQENHSPQENLRPNSLEPRHGQVHEEANEHTCIGEDADVVMMHVEDFYS
jgi:hypothetical protein